MDDFDIVNQYHLGNAAPFMDDARDDASSKFFYNVTFQRARQKLVTLQTI